MDNWEKCVQKSDALNMRISLGAKAVLKDIGQGESSMANSLEWLVAEYPRSWEIESPRSESTEGKNVTSR